MFSIKEKLKLLRVNAYTLMKCFLLMFLSALLMAVNTEMSDRKYHKIIILDDSVIFWIRNISMSIVHNLLIRQKASIRSDTYKHFIRFNS